MSTPDLSAAASPPLLLLPDLSEFQYPPDHPQPADMAGIKKQNGGAAIIRVAYGTRADNGFAHFRAAAAAAGYRFLGIYQYLRAGQDPVASVQAMRAITGPLHPWEIPVCDLEEGTGSQAGRAAAWLAAADAEYGLASRPLPQRSWLYSYVAFVLGHGLGPLFASGRRTWIAAYQGAEPSVGHTLWQCTDGQLGPHITSWPGAGKCDTSVFHGTLGQLAAIITPTGPFRRVADGSVSLATLAARRATTVAHLTEVTLAHATPAEAAAFRAYLDNRMPGGLVYYTSAP
jgi:hypothetical protein